MFYVSDVSTHTHAHIWKHSDVLSYQCMYAYTHRWSHTPHFKIQLSWDCGISALHAKWLWVSARHPQCETADNKIMAMSGAFVVRPDDSILLARRKRPNVSSTMWWLVSFDPRNEQHWNAFFMRRWCVSDLCVCTCVHEWVVLRVRVSRISLYVCLQICDCMYDNQNELESDTSFMLQEMRFFFFFKSQISQRYCLS